MASRMGFLPYYEHGSCQLPTRAVPEERLQLGTRASPLAISSYVGLKLRLSLLFELVEYSYMRARHLQVERYACLSRSLPQDRMGPENGHCGVRFQRRDANEVTISMDLKLRQPLFAKANRYNRFIEGRDLWTSLVRAAGPQMHSERKLLRIAPVVKGACHCLSRISPQLLA